MQQVYGKLVTKGSGKWKQNRQLLIPQQMLASPKLSEELVGSHFFWSDHIFSAKLSESYDQI